MTENEAIKAIENDLEWHSKELQPKYKKVLRYVITALKEIQQYRAIGTIEEFKVLKEEVELCRNLDKTNFSDGYNKAIDEFAEKLSLEVSESIIWDMLATMSKNSSLSDTSDKIVDYVINTANEIAKQLKAGGENE